MVDTVKYIFAESETIGSIKIHPVQMKHYDEFMSIANILTIHYDFFDVEASKRDLGISKLMDLVLYNHATNGQFQDAINVFEKIFTFVCKQEVKFDTNVGAFFINNDDELFINSENYDEIRKVILRQNLIFEPKVYKDKMTQQWADLALKAKAQSALKISTESMLALIVAFNGMDVNILYNYSIYQIKTIFQFVLKLKSYDTSVLFKSVGSDISIEHFAEEIDMFKSPYDDVIKDSSELSKLNSIVSGKI